MRRHRHPATAAPAPPPAAGSLTPTVRARRWDLTVKTMSVGEKAVVVIHPDYAYGNNGAGDMIQPGATLTFEIELVEVIPEPSPMGTVLLQIAALIFIVLVVLFILWHQGHAFHGGKGHPHPSGDNKWHPPESRTGTASTNVARPWESSSGVLHGHGSALWVWNRMHASLTA